VSGSVSLRYRVFDTPVGPLTVVCDPDAVGDLSHGPDGPVVASGFGDLADIVPSPHQDMAEAELAEVGAAVAAYFDGEVSALDRVAVAQAGPPFRRDAWNAMRKIPAGQVRSYAELADLAGRPGAARAAGSACASNEVAPFVPCHRVVRTGGAVGQYGFGVATKEALLRHEGYLRQ